MVCNSAWVGYTKYGDFLAFTSSLSTVHDYVIHRTLNLYLLIYILCCCYHQSEGVLTSSWASRASVMWCCCVSTMFTTWCIHHLLHSVLFETINPLWTRSKSPMGPYHQPTCLLLICHMWVRMFGSEEVCWHQLTEHTQHHIWNEVKPHESEY